MKRSERLRAVVRNAGGMSKEAGAQLRLEREFGRAAIAAGLTLDKIKQLSIPDGRKRYAGHPMMQVRA